jgi:hypothetical protein
MLMASLGFQIPSGTHHLWEIPLGISLFVKKTSSAGIDPRSPGVQAVPYRVNYTKRKEYLVVCTPRFTYGVK